MYQGRSFAQANSIGLFVNAHLHEILLVIVFTSIYYIYWHYYIARSLNNIILLKKNQSYPEIDMSDLYKAMLDEYRNHEKVDQKTFTKIIEAFRVI